MISLSETALSSITVPYFDFQCKDFRRKFYNIDDSFAHAIRKGALLQKAKQQLNARRICILLKKCLKPMN